MSVDTATVAIVTATYRGDFERCRLLCDSIDARVTGHTNHYLLVEERDRALFAPLAGPRRVVLSERDLLPWWLCPVRDPFDRRRRLWLHPFGLPLRGWHAQQLRRIAFAAAMEEAVMIACDSDVVFVRDFDAATLAGDGGRVRFYRVPNGIDEVSADMEAEHDDWSRAAGRLLGIAVPATTRTGYITTLVPWRRDSVREMMAQISRTAGGRSAMRALVATRSLSECTIYGRFIDEVEGRADRHAPTHRPLASVRWSGEALGRGEIQSVLAALSEDQVAVCIQSFIGTDPALIRSVAGL